jgi:predicted N-acetyltransferase YhbS
MNANSSEVSYSVENDLAAAEFIDVLNRSGLAERRPVGEPDAIAKMLKHGNLIVCARDTNGQLIGVSRALTDFSFCCYLSDLAVDKTWQGKGIGKELMRRTHEGAGGPKGVTMLLLSAPSAMNYYPQAGLDNFDNCFGWRRTG